MKNFVFALFLGLTYFGGKVTAQEFEDLLVLYVDEKYEKCFFKALKYTESDKTKSEPLPYLYCSMTLFEMSQNAEYKDEFPKAFKDAISFAGKYRKKDKAYAYREESEEHIETLKTILTEEVENYMLAPDERAYKKAYGLVKKMVKMDPNCVGSELLKAQLTTLTGNKTEGKKQMVVAKDRLDKVGEEIQFGDMTESQQKLFKYSLIFVSNSINAKDPEGAKEMISRGQQYFGEEREDCLLEDNADFKDAYTKITG